MRRYRRVWVVYRKELVETLRDRRTLIAMVVVPIVLYPALMIILLEALKTETSRREREQYTICVPDEAHAAWLTAVLEREDAERKALEERLRQAATAAGQPTADLGDGLSAYLSAEQVEVAVRPAESLWELIRQQHYHAAVVIEPPPDPSRPADGTNRVVQLIFRETDPRSEFVSGQLGRIFGNEASRIVRSRVHELSGTDALLRPLVINALSTATPQQQIARIVAMVVPFLLVTMTVTGALYPAIDLTAGERERGTLETLAVAPVPVGQIVAGKFGVIVTIAMFSTALNLGSMTAMVYFSKLDQIAGSLRPAERAESLLAQQQIEQEGLPPGVGAFTQRAYLLERERLEREAAHQAGFFVTSAPIVMLAMVPFAVLFGGVMLAACSFARTFKEAQNYMMPVMMAAIIPAMIMSYMPMVRLEGLLLVIPVANIVVLMRELFLGQYDLTAMAVCLLSTSLYAAAAVTLAAKLYGHEAVLFSDVGSYRTLLRRRFIRPEPSPSPALALLVVALLFPVNFYWQSYALDLGSSAQWFRGVVAAAQIGIFGAPVLLLTGYFRLDPATTFSLRRPRFVPTLAAGLIGLSVVPVSHLLQQVQFHFFPPQPLAEEVAARQQEWLTGGSVGAMLLVFAVLPGLCEELLFRGFLMSGLRRKLSAGGLVVVVGLIFGLYHMSSEKLPLVTLLGVLLTLICLRTDSIFPAMFVHMANNGLALAAARYGAVKQLFGMSADATAGVQLSPRAGLFAAVFLIGLVLLVRRGRPDRSSPP